jgi:hypothetical protein
MTDAELEQLIADRGDGVAVRTIALLKSMRALCERTGVDFDELVRKSVPE